MVTDLNSKELKTKDSPKSHKTVTVGIRAYSEITLSLGYNSDELKEFLTNAHCTQITIHNPGDVQSKLKGLNVDLLLQKHEAIAVRVTRLKEKKVQRFASKAKKKMRSLASCETVIQGLTLSTVSETIFGTNKEEVSRRARVANNQFTGFQRTDRHTGKKMTEFFMEQYGLSTSDSVPVLEFKTGMKITILDHEGYIKYWSTVTSARHVCLCEEAPKLYLVRNFCGFSRID